MISFTTSLRVAKLRKPIRLSFRAPNTPAQNRI